MSDDTCRLTEAGVVHTIERHHRESRDVADFARDFRPEHLSHVAGVVGEVNLLLLQGEDDFHLVASAVWPAAAKRNR